MATHRLLGPRPGFPERQIWSGAGALVAPSSQVMPRLLARKLYLDNIALWGLYLTLFLIMSFNSHTTQGKGILKQSPLHRRRRSILLKVVQLVYDGAYIQAAPPHTEAVCWSAFRFFLDCVQLITALLWLQVAALAFFHFPLTTRRQLGQNVVKEAISWTNKPCSTEDMAKLPRLGCGLACGAPRW